MRVRDMERFLFVLFFVLPLGEYIFSLFSSLLKNCIFWDPQKFSKKKNFRVGFRVSEKVLSTFCEHRRHFYPFSRFYNKRTKRSKRCRRRRRSTRSSETRASSTRSRRRRRQKLRIAKDRCRRTTRKALVVVRIESMAMRFSPPPED